MPNKLTDAEIVKALEKQANEKRCIFEQHEEACGMWCKYHRKWCADMSGIDNKQNCAEYTPSSAIRIAKAILDLINRLQAENEGLKYDYDNLQRQFEEIYQQFHYLSNVEIPYLYSFTEDKDKKLETIANILLRTKSEAYKEFAERLKDMHKHNTTSVVSLVTVFDNINNLVKELIGE